jgi:transcription initiation factor IIE alpha subunit
MDNPVLHFLYKFVRTFGNDPMQAIVFRVFGPLWIRSVDGNVDEKDLSSRLSLRISDVRRILQSLENDGILKKRSASKTPRSLSALSSPLSSSTPSPTSPSSRQHNIVDGLWYIDLLSVYYSIRYRICIVTQKLHLSRDKELDSTEMHYTCRNEGCGNFGAEWTLLQLFDQCSVIDLLGFRCPEPSGCGKLVELVPGQEPVQRGISLFFSGVYCFVYGVIKQVFYLCIYVGCIWCR